MGMENGGLAQPDMGNMENRNPGQPERADVENDTPGQPERTEGGNETPGQPERADVENDTPGQPFGGEPAGADNRGDIYGYIDETEEREPEPQERRKDRSFLRFLLWAVIVFAPVIAGFVIGLVSGTSPLKLDAWNTTWNDENGYFRVIRTMRHYGVPQGMTGFNEISSGNVPFGPYNLFTYIPYYLLSYLTGCSSHNYIYLCNIILAVLANLLFVALVRPRKKNAFLLAVFFLTQLIAARYTWSGMAEAVYHFYIVVFTGLVIWYLRHAEAGGVKKGLALILMVLLTFFFGVMRPYFAALFLIPLYLLIFRTPKLREAPRFLCSLLMLAAMFGTVILMYFFMGYIAEYFEIAPAMKLAMIVRTGEIREIVLNLVQLNRDSVREALGLVREYRWAGGIAFLFYFEWLILLVEWLASLLMRKKDGSAAVLFLLLVSGAMFYEATILLYKSYQLHRMLLAITIAYSLFLIEFGILLPWINMAAVIVCTGFYLVMKPAAFALPQVSGESVLEAELTQEKKELVSLLPPAPVPENGIFEAPASLDPYWENTVAKTAEENHLQVSFLLPDYLSLNVCTGKYLQEAIENETLSSRYLMVKTDSELDGLCAGKYRLLWQKRGHSIYDCRAAANPQ